MDAQAGNRAGNGSTHGRTPRMITVGAICSATIYQVEAIPPPNAKRLAKQICHLIDGMALAAACAFEKLGGRAHVWSRVGDDAAGTQARAMMAEEGLDVSGLHVVPNSTTSTVAIIVDALGNRMVIPYHDPNAETSAAWLPLDELAAVDMVHCETRWAEGAEVALRAARSRNIPSMIDGDVGPLPVLQRLVPLADYAVFSDAGLLVYAECGSLEEALLAVGAKHHGHVGASCGPDGYRWYDGGRLQHVPAPKVEVVDTLGAGDVFHGAFGLAVLEGKSIRDAARFACAAASLKCTRFGGRLGCPTRSETEALAARTYGS
jgi:sulfofructose kinase